MCLFRFHAKSSPTPSKDPLKSFCLPIAKYRTPRRIIQRPRVSSKGDHIELPVHIVLRFLRAP
ncbi:hypothetical protein WN55_04353 [Dufourea novaeangliae]|uniref:Uncharacterized protein n=1 Tax=Dufourea novaeangliae TaxID=178035 RepID=A0A154PLU3_DUFNO|nr:hypothetical protein WN55_04353 [Dufourea novaeangliae]